MKQIHACGLFNINQMNHCKDYSKTDRIDAETTTHFKELVESINIYKENSRSMASQHGFKSAANVQERKKS